MRRSTLLIVTLLAAASIASPRLSFAQRSGRDMAEFFFSRMDGNGDGYVEGDEWNRFPSLSRGLTEQGLNSKKPMALDQFRAALDGIVKVRRRGESRVSSQALNRDGGSRGRRPSAPASQKRPCVTVPLPEEFRSRDTDADGQIAFYEWPRAERPTFFQLDLNGDGFLTPRELVTIAKRKIAEAVPRKLYVSPHIGDNGAVSSPTRGKTAIPFVSKTVTDSSATRIPQSSGTDGGRDLRSAELIFRFLDRDKDMTLVKAEFTRSQTIQAMFLRAGIDLSSPMSRDEFVADYVRLKASTTARSRE